VVRAARFEALARGRCFIRIDRFTGIRILLGSVLDVESADPPSRMGNSIALRRGRLEGRSWREQGGCPGRVRQ